MTMGLSMALHEEGILDPRYGWHVANHDFASYHIATNADVGSIEVHWLDEDDPYFNPMGSKGLGELGIVGTAAAIANAVYHATGIRVRDLPITLDKLLRCAPYVHRAFPPLSRMSAVRKVRHRLGGIPGLQVLARVPMCRMSPPRWWGVLGRVTAWPSGRNTGSVRQETWSTTSTNNR
jgi:hypothetical protein